MILFSISAVGQDTKFESDFVQEFTQDIVRGGVLKKLYLKLLQDLTILILHYLHLVFIQKIS